MWIDGIFSGGGVKAFAYVGAIEAVEKAGYQFKRVAGTSAGSLVAGLIAAGYTSQEMKQILKKLEPKLFLDRNSWFGVPFLNWVGLYKKMGLYKGDVFEKWVFQILDKKGIRTFQDLEHGALTIVATDISSGQLLKIPNDLPKYGLDPKQFLVSKAIRMSCGLPFFFKPVEIKNKEGGKSLIVDGGLISNLPLWLFNDETPLKRPYIGFQLGQANGTYENRNITNAYELFQHVFETIKIAHDVGILSKAVSKNVCYLPVDFMKMTNFNLSKEEQERLVQVGKLETSIFLKNWVSNNRVLL